LAHSFDSGIGNADQKKKKKKKKPKKKAKGGEVKQTDPPRVGLSKIFTNGIYPEGETHEYPK
jgi:methionyl aminopeptidase